VKNPDEIFEIRASLHDNDDEQTLISGYFNAPSKLLKILVFKTFDSETFFHTVFLIEPKTIEGSMDMDFSRFSLKISEGEKSTLEVLAGVDMGTSDLGDFGLHNFFKLDASIQYNGESSVWSKKVMVEAQQAKHGVRIFVHTPFNTWSDVKLVAKVNEDGNGCDLEFLKDNDQISAAVKFVPESRSHFVIEANIKSTFHSFREFILAGKINFVNSPMIVEVLAKTENSDHLLDIKAELSNDKGMVKMTSVLPILGLNERDLQVIGKMWHLSG